MENKLNTIDLIINQVRQVKVLVIGDFMLDVYEWCDVKRISPEAPVPVAHVTREDVYLGGAANVAHNLSALGIVVSVCGVVGNDENGVLMRSLLREKNITDGVCVENGRFTTTKKRIMSGTQQMLRIDHETTRDVEVSTEDSMLACIRAQIPVCDAIILSDYCKGVLTNRIVSTVMEEAQIHDKRVFVDSKNKHFYKYKGAYLIKPNREEAEHFAGEAFKEGYENLSSIAKKIAEMFESQVVITLGKDGIAFTDGNVCVRKATKAEQVFDVSGAGDTVLAVLAAVITSGGSLEDAVDAANHAAGYVVRHLGTTVCPRDVLQELIHDAV